jgi:hypothetical protein
VAFLSALYLNCVRTLMQKVQTHISYAVRRDGISIAGVSADGLDA